jgi:hypothetical protein
MAVFLYGFFYLKNNNTSYIGITCPSCIKTILIKENKPTSTLFEKFASESVLIDIDDRCHRLTYFTSIYHVDSISKFNIYLQDFNSSSHFHKYFPELNENIDDDINAYENENELDKHLRSFAGKGYFNLGIRLLAIFVDEQHLENLVRFEQEQNIRIIPRYFHRLDLLEDIELLCVNHAAEGPFKDAEVNLNELKQSCEGLYDLKVILEEDNSILTPELLNKFIIKNDDIKEIQFCIASDFMKILAADPYPWDIPKETHDWIKKLWKQPYPLKSKEVHIALDSLKESFKPCDENDKDHKKKVAEINSVFSKCYIQKLLIKQCEEFIKDYKQIAMKYALSYADVWRLKEQHLEIIYQAIRKDPDDEYKQACREIAMKLWAQDEKLTIPAIVKNAEIQKIKQIVNYTDKTIEKWIKDLNPDNSPGRPKKNHTTTD